MQRFGRQAAADLQQPSLAARDTRLKRRPQPVPRAAQSILTPLDPGPQQPGAQLSAGHGQMAFVKGDVALQA